ncbi:MAG: hypothetical protein ACOCV2_02775 [Persicimonas sp.]
MGTLAIITAQPRMSFIRRRGMFNSEAKAEAIEKLEEVVERHESVREGVEEKSVELFEQRKRAAGTVISRVEGLVNRLANSPKEFDKTVAEYQARVDRFDETVQRIEAEAQRAESIGKTSGAAGAAAGVGVAMFGPTAAMAIATTFGTASTGTAIASLSGAAASQAALAWLGGGAVAAGGGGVAVGQTILALAGPVGWGLGGVALVGSGVFLHRQNAKIAEEATEQRVEVEAEVKSLEVARREIEGLLSQTREHADGCLEEVEWLEKKAPADYADFDQADKKRLAALINHIESLGALLQDEVTA